MCMVLAESPFWHLYGWMSCAFDDKLTVFIEDRRKNCSTLISLVLYMPEGSSSCSCILHGHYLSQCSHDTLQNRLTSFRSEEYTRNVFFLKMSCLYLFCNCAILSVPESYVQCMVPGIQNLNSSLIYKAFAVLVSILHEKCKGSKTP